MRNSLFVLGFAAFLTGFISCKKSTCPGFEQTETGLCYKKVVSGKDTLKARNGDLVVFTVVFKTDKDSLVLDSRRESRDGTGCFRTLSGKISFKGSFEEAYSLMSPGDSIDFLVSADSVYHRILGFPDTAKLPSFIVPGSQLHGGMKLMEIMDKTKLAEMQKQNQEAQQKQMEEKMKMAQERKALEPKEIGDYISQNKIMQKPTAEGLYYIEKNKGSGDLIKAGQSVTMKYTGKFLNGEIFDATDKHGGQPFTFSPGSGQVIAGWEKGVLLMNKGCKADLLIPSSLGYGEMGQGPIPPCTPLLFELEVVDVK